MRRGKRQNVNVSSRMCENFKFYRCMAWVDQQYTRPMTMKWAWGGIKGGCEWKPWYIYMYIYIYCIIYPFSCYVSCVTGTYSYNSAHEWIGGWMNERGYSRWVRWVYTMKKVLQARIFFVHLYDTCLGVLKRWTVRTFLLHLRVIQG